MGETTRYGLWGLMFLVIAATSSFLFQHGRETLGVWLMLCGVAALLKIIFEHVYH